MPFSWVLFNVKSPFPRIISVILKIWWILLISIHNFLIFLVYSFEMFLSHILHFLFMMQQVWWYYTVKIWTMIVKTRNWIHMHKMCWDELSYEILDIESKLLQIKKFHIFHGSHEFNFLKDIFLPIQQHY